MMMMMDQRRKLFERPYCSFRDKLLLYARAIPYYPPHTLLHCCCPCPWLIHFPFSATGALFKTDCSYPVLLIRWMIIMKLSAKIPQHFPFCGNKNTDPSFAFIFLWTLFCAFRLIKCQRDSF